MPYWAAMFIYCNDEFDGFYNSYAHLRATVIQSFNTVYVNSTLKTASIEPKSTALLQQITKK